MFEVLGEAAVAIEPSQRALDNPTTRQNNEALGRIGTLDDLDGPFADLKSVFDEITLLEASVRALGATLNNPRADGATRQAFARQLRSAVLPLMKRANITEKMATVAGYPAWPDIDRTEMPGQDDDFCSVHLIRIHATTGRLSALKNHQFLLDDIIGKLASEIVPPLRALEAALAEVETSTTRAVADYARLTLATA